MNGLQVVDPLVSVDPIGLKDILELKDMLMGVSSFFPVLDVFSYWLFLNCFVNHPFSPLPPHSASIYPGQ